MKDTSDGLRGSDGEDFRGKPGTKRMKDGSYGLRGSDGEVFLRSMVRSTLLRRQAQRLDVVLVAVMELVSGENPVTKRTKDSLRVPRGSEPQVRAYLQK